MCDVDGDALTLIYKVVGRGTEAMSRIQPGEKLDALVGLGNGYDTLDECGDRPMLIGGGVGRSAHVSCWHEGFCPRRGRNRSCLGFNARERDFLRQRNLRTLGAKVVIATADGSYGVQRLRHRRDEAAARRPTCRLRLRPGADAEGRL